MPWIRLVAALSFQSLINPALGLDLLRVAWRFRVRGWWHRFPFIPIPSLRYVRWRMYTAYGDEQAVPPVHDVIAYARWTGRQP